AYTKQVEYDGIGQVQSQSLEAVGDVPAQRIDTQYNFAGQPVGLSVTDGSMPGNEFEPLAWDVFTPTGDPNALVTGVSTGATGLFESRTYGNGVVRQVAWDDVWRTPDEIVAYYDDGGAVFVQRDVLTRDAQGRVTAIEAAHTVGSAIGEVQCFDYDGFNRLAQAWTQDVGVGAPEVSGASTASAVAGAVQVQADPATSFATQWSYSASGRIVDVINIATSGAVLTDTYGYDV